MGKEKFLYNRVSNEIIRRIDEGTYKVGNKLPSERELGLEFDVDRTTIRKALDILVDGNYIIKIPGKGTIIKDKDQLIGKNIGFLMLESGEEITNISNPFYSELFFYLKKEIEKIGYTLNYIFYKETDLIRDIVKKNDLIAIFFVSFLSEGHYEELKKNNFPFVLLNGYHRGCASIMTNGRKGMFELTNYLLNKGYKKIVVVEGDKKYFTNTERRKGVLDALSSKNVDGKEVIFLGGNSWEYDDSYCTTKKYIESNSEIPEVFMAFNDRMALGIINALRDSNINNVLVTGYDNSKSVKLLCPNLMTISTRIDYMADIATIIMEKEMTSKKNFPVEIFVETELNI